MEQAFKRLLDAITNALLALRAGQQETGGLTPEQEKQLEDATQEITALQAELQTDEGRLTTDEAKETADVSGLAGRVASLEAVINSSAGSPGLVSRVTDLETHVGDLEAAAQAQAADAAAAADKLNPPAALSISPTAGTLAAATAGASISVSISGGTGNYTASGLPAGVTQNGNTLQGDGTQVAGVSTITFTDASTPPLTASFVLTVQ